MRRFLIVLVVRPVELTSDTVLSTANRHRLQPVSIYVFWKFHVDSILQICRRPHFHTSMYQSSCSSTEFLKLQRICQKLLTHLCNVLLLFIKVICSLCILTIISYNICQSPPQIDFYSFQKPNIANINNKKYVLPNTGLNLELD